MEMEFSFIVEPSEEKQKSEQPFKELYKSEPREALQEWIKQFKEHIKQK